MINALIAVIVGCLILYAIRLVVRAFSPSALVSQLIDVVLFIIALLLVVKYLVPLVV